MNVKYIIAAIIMSGLFYLGGQYISSQPQRIQKETEAQREISVQGTGKINRRPDIARFSLGVSTGPQNSADAAMKILTQKFNNVVSTVKQEGVKEEDIKTTNLSVRPIYDYSEGKQILRGFEASENIEIKIRDLNKIGTILSKSALQGANEAGGISFDVDEPEKIRLEAQKKAIENAESKAKELARSLGVGLGKVKTFSSSDAAPSYPPVYRDAVGLGMSSPEQSKSVEVPSGTNEFVANVTVTYELR